MKLVNKGCCGFGHREVFENISKTILWDNFISAFQNNFKISSRSKNQNTQQIKKHSQQKAPLFINEREPCDIYRKLLL